MNLKKLVKKYSRKEYMAIVGILIVGIILGRLFFGGSHTNDTSTSTEEVHDHSKDPSFYTCSMHPQIKQDKPGNCPICGMELIPMDDGSDDGEEGLSLSEIKMSKSAMKIADVQTITIESKTPYKEVYFPGKVQPDERNIVELTARFGGRIEKLTINFTGQKVSKGQILASIYSPDLVTAQRELFEAIKYKGSNTAFYTAARNKLKLWDLTDEQIDGIEATGEPIFYFDVLSPITGTVMMRHVAIGDYIKEGDPLFKVINLNHLWVMFEAYESDIPWVKLGDKINFTIKSIPSKVFTSTVTFIDPVINPKKRIVYVRTELNNKGDLLKPEMFASGILKTMLPGVEEAIVVPKSAILWTGKRAIVYVKVPNREMVFEHREIELGEDAESYYVVKSGLNEGEVVVTNGVFKIDAASQLLSKQSMMTPAGGKSSLGGHAGMDMGGDSKKKNESMDMPDEPKKKMKMENISPEFKTQLGVIVNKYLDVKDALVYDDASSASAAAKEMKAAIEKVNMKLLTDNDHHMEWMNSSKMLNTSLDIILSGSDIKKQRAAFENLSNDLINVTKVMGVNIDKSLYVTYCPMVQAYWISMDKEIKNPYYGQSMLKCGEVKEELTTK